MNKIVGKCALIGFTVTASLLAGCTSSGTKLNRSLDSIHQPVVTQNNFVMDLDAYGGGVDCLRTAEII